MTSQTKYRPHSVVRSDRDDGTILLTSGYAMSEPVQRTTDWLARWAQETPDALFLAERNGAGWREESYAAVQQQVQAIAASLLARGLGRHRPILIFSGNGVDHALLTLAAQMIGVPTVPVAEQYALIPEAHKQLVYVAGVVRPGLVYAVDGDLYGAALSLDVFDGIEKVVSSGNSAGRTRVSDLLIGDPGVDLVSAAARVGPDTIAKILMTSGSTSSPKGVLTTQRMMCVNQAQIADALPFLKARPPVLVDWLPWNHVFGSSHNFNMVLANGGSLYIDNGKPVKGLVDRTIENLSLVSGTIAFNVPVGFAMLRDAMRADPDLRRTYFRNLDMLFYAGASLPQSVWTDLETMAREVKGEMPLFTSSWGLTETAPGTLIQHEPTQISGVVGVPMTGTEIKLIPDNDMRCEIRVKGPNIFPGYLNDPEKTAAAFDEEGYFITGDAMKFVDIGDPNKGLRFDGRISEDFKLSTGIWVRAANLRLSVLAELAPLAVDVVVCGADRDQIGLMLFPSADALALAEDNNTDCGAISSAALAAEIRTRLAGHEAEGSSSQVRRVIVLADPPSMPDGEMTAKGNLNFRKVLTRRSALLRRLYEDADPATILI